MVLAMEGKNLLEFRDNFHNFRNYIKFSMNFYRFKLALARLKLTDIPNTKYIYLIFLNLEQIKIYPIKFVSYFSEFKLNLYKF
jgi:hypothetical protein